MKGARSDVIGLRTSPYCHFNFSAVQGGRIVCFLFFLLESERLRQALQQQQQTE